MEWEIFEGLLSNDLFLLLVGAVIGFGASRLLDRFRAGDRRKEAARALVAAATPLLELLSDLSRSFDRVQEAHPDDLALHFKTVEDFQVEAKLRDLREARASGNSLPHRCVEAWGAAEVSASKVLRHHIALKKQVGLLGSQLELERSAPGYRRMLGEAESAFEHALRSTRGSAAKDTGMAISRLAGD